MESISGDNIVIIHTDITYAELASLHTSRRVMRLSFMLHVGPHKVLRKPSHRWMLCLRCSVVCQHGICPGRASKEHSTAATSRRKRQGGVPRLCQGVHRVVPGVPRRCQGVHRVVPRGARKEFQGRGACVGVAHGGTEGAWWVQDCGRGCCGGASQVPGSALGSQG
jgi:hypothetical protein